MTAYIIGDVQGCYDPLQRLLEKIRFDESRDTIWFTGDIVNRGPDSLKVIQFIYQHRAVIKTILGNHDLTLLAVAKGSVPFQAERHTFSDILEHSQREEYLDWLLHCPLAHFDQQNQILLVHAGVVPQWDVAEALSLAQEVEQRLVSDDCAELLHHLYGNTPLQWSPDLQGWERYRFIVNVLTRIRFCTPEGKLDLVTKEGAHAAPPGYVPWFTAPRLVARLKESGIKIVFGHWAALEGKTSQAWAVGLDTGCVWGNQLTAYAVESGSRFCIDCPRR